MLGFRLAKDLLHDLQYAVRILTKTPGFAAAAILTVALGIGATTGIFSVVYSVALRPLPYADPSRLVNIWTKAPRLGLERAFVTAADYRDWREQNTVFEDLALVRNIANLNLTGEGEPERLQAARFTASLFSTLRVQPVLGRAFRDDEEKIGNEFVVLLSDGLWRRRFGTDKSIVGKVIQLNGQPHTIVGVMGPEFRYPGREFELWTPLTVNPQDYITRFGGNYLSVARLKPGVDVARAQAEIDSIMARLAKQYPASNQGMGALVAPMLQDTVGSLSTALYVILEAVACLLLIGCANLANLLFARVIARGRELQVRVALGAGTGRLVVQSIAEVIPIVSIGGMLGVLFAAWGLGLLIPLLPASMPRVEEIRISTPTFAR